MMKKHLPLDDFEREVQRLADGFEIQPRAMVFEQIRSELAAQTPVAGKGKVLKGIFSKSLNFISYAAAASVATVASVLVYQQQESVKQQERALSSFQQVQNNQSQTLTQRLSDTTSTLAYETAVNEVKAANVVTENVQPLEQPLASSEVQLANTTAKDAKRVHTSENKVSSTTTPTPRISKQVKRADNTLIAESTRERKQQKQEKSNTAVVNETKATPPAINENSTTGGSSSSAPQPTIALNQNQQTNTAETSQEQNTSTNPVPVKENNVAEVIQDSVMTGLVVDSTITIASVADTTTLDTTGTKRTLAARNWIKKGVWSVAGYYSLEANRTDLDIPVSSDPGYYYESYKSFMNKTTQQTTSFSTGLKLEYNFLNNWGVSTGFTFAERKEYLSVDKYNELLYNLASANWEVNTVTTAGYSQQIRNTFTYLEVPALVHYTNTISGRFAFRLSAGVSYSYLMKQSASFIDMSDRNALIGPAPVYHQSSRISETPFRQHNINLQLGANVSYLVAPRMEIFAGPHFKRSLLSTYASGYPFRQRFSATGGETGVRFYF